MEQANPLVGTTGPEPFVLDAFPALAPGDLIKPQPRRVPRRPCDRAVPCEEGAPAGIQILTSDGIDDLQAPERPKQVPRLHVEPWVDVREFGSSAQHHGQSLSPTRSCTPRRQADAQWMRTAMFAPGSQNAAVARVSKVEARVVIGHRDVVMRHLLLKA